MICTINLESLSCFQSAEANGDEIYLMYGGKKLWPKDKKYAKFNSGSESEKEVELEINNIRLNMLVSIEVWEHDTFFDDKLGAFEFLVDNKGSFIADLKKDKAKVFYKYRLKWSVGIKKDIFEITK